MRRIFGARTFIKHSSRAGLARQASQRDVLRLREGQLRGIFDSASEGIVTADASQRIVMANPAAAEMFRCRVADLLGAPLSRLMPERFRAGHEHAVAAFGAGDSPPVRMGSRRDLMALRADGEEFPVEAGISQVHVDGMRLYTVILRDLSGERRTAEALRRSERLMAATFEASTVAMAQIDSATRRFLAVNAAMCELSGYDEAELLRMGPDDLNHPQDQLDLARYGALLEGSAPYRVEKRLLRKDGAMRWIEVSGSAVRDAGGAPLFLVAVVHDITARREAEAALQAREARQSFLVRLSDQLRGLDDARAVAYEASCMLRQFAGVSRVGYGELDENGPYVLVGPNCAHGVPVLEGVYPVTSKALLEALRAGASIVRADLVQDGALSADEKAAFARLQIGAAVAVPLASRSRVAAVFYVHSASPRNWTVDEVALFEDVAERVRADIERARAEAALRTRESQKAFLVRLNDRLRDLEDPHAIAYEACCLLGRFIGAARVIYAEDDGNGETITAVRGYTFGVPDLAGCHRYADYGAEPRRALLDGRTLVRPDIAAEIGLSAAEKATYTALQVAAAVQVPLQPESRLPAVLLVHSVLPRRWTADEVALFEDVARRIRADIERARAEADVRSARRTLEAALESMSDAVSVSDASGMPTHFNTGFARFHRCAGKDECRRKLAQSPELLEVFLADGTPAAAEERAVPRALRGETGVNVEYGLRRSDTGERWIGSFNFAPIRDEHGAIVGSVVVGRDITAFKRMHAQLQASYAELQRLVDAQDRVQQVERLRIARELHDDLQQGLAAIVMQSTAVRQRLAGRDAAVERSLASIVRIGEQVIASTRRIVQDLRPQLLDDLGLVAALEALAAQFTRSFGVPCTVDAAEPQAADPARLAAAGSCLYRVAQEALNNVGKHAQARSVQVELAETAAPALRLAIHDDGIGMNTGQRPDAAGFGLLGMRERVRAAGGTLRITSQPGQGTTVEVEVPLAGGADAAAR